MLAVGVEGFCVYRPSLLAQPVRLQGFRAGLKAETKKPPETFQSSTAPSVPATSNHAAKTLPKPFNPKP